MIDTDTAVALDAFGLTDRGLVREGNEDHFLIARVNKSIDVRQTSLPSAAVAHTVRVPELIAVNACPPVTAAGVGVLVNVCPPRPSCPYTFDPQQTAFVPCSAQT